MERYMKMASIVLRILLLQIIFFIIINIPEDTSYAATTYTDQGVTYSYNGNTNTNTYSSTSNSNTLTITGSGTVTDNWKNSSELKNYVTSVRSIVFNSNNITAIGSNAFSNCTALTSVTIPDTVTTIGSNAYSGCTSLETITIGTGVKSIGENAFDNAPLTTQIQYNATNCTTYNNAFASKQTLAVNIGDNVTVIPENFLKENKTIKYIVIPASVTTIKADAFSGSPIPDGIWIRNRNCTIETTSTITNFTTVFVQLPAQRQYSSFTGGNFSTLLKWLNDNNKRYMPFALSEEDKNAINSSQSVLSSTGTKLAWASRLNDYKFQGNREWTFQRSSNGTPPAKHSKIIQEQELGFSSWCYWYFPTTFISKSTCSNRPSGSSTSTTFYVNAAGQYDFFCIVSACNHHWIQGRVEVVDTSGRTVGTAFDTGKYGGVEIYGPVYTTTVNGETIYPLNKTPGIFHASIQIPQAGNYTVKFTSSAGGNRDDAAEVVGFTVFNDMALQPKKSVTCIDIIKGTDIELGRTTRNDEFGMGDTVSGAMFGNSTKFGFYYKDYVYTDCTQAVVGESGTTVYRYFVYGIHELTVNPNGGTWLSSNQVRTFDMKYEETKSIPLPIRQGHTFKGWTLTGEGSSMTSLIADATFKMALADSTLTANWEPYSAKITLNKTDSVTGEALNEAIFGLYEWNGSTYVRIGTLTDNGDGTYNTEVIEYSDTNLGKYKIVEESAPMYYTNSGWSKDILIADPGYHEYVYNVTNDPNKVKAQAIKIDDETGNRIQGATFTIYEWNKEIGEYVEYARDITMDFQEDRSYLSEWLYSNRRNEGKFRIVETLAPDGYYGDFASSGNKVTNDIVITQNLDGQTIILQNEEGLYKNTRVKGTINLDKIDTETEKSLAQGDATLDGAVYGLYAAEDIYHKDTVIGKLYSKDELVQTEKTVNGRLSFEDVEIGRYYIKEITAPEGYLPSEETYEINMNYEGETVIHLTRSLTIKEQVIKQAFKLLKVSMNIGDTELYPLLDAGFKIYLISDLEGVKNGTIKPNSRGIYDPESFIDYDFSNDQTAIDYSENPNGERIPELFTNEYGELTSPELAYGKYVVIESTVPEDLEKIRPFIVTIEEDSRTPQKQRYFLDKEFEALIRVVKKDNQTGETVLGKNAKYRIWSVDDEKYIEQAVTYPTVVVYGTEDNPYQINENGEFITPLKLPVGEYELREITAPDGYILAGYEGKMENGVYTEINEPALRFRITTNTVYYEKEDVNEFIIDVLQYNDEMLGELEITKIGEQLTGVQTREDGTIDPLYEEIGVEGAEFGVYAKEDIYTQDNQGTKIYEKDELVQKITTNEEGKAYLDDLPMGKYYVKEEKAGKGFILNKEIKEFEITYQGEKTAVQKIEMSYKNERQTVNLGEKEGLKIEKLADKTVYKSGEKIVYTIKVTNTTQYTIKDIKVSETILKGKFEDISTNNVTKTGDKTVEIKELKPGESVELKFISEIKASEDLDPETKKILDEEKVKIENIVKATGQMTIPDPNNPENTITTEIEGEGKEDIYVSNKDLVIVKEAVKAEYEVGEKVQYIIKVINNGQEEITDVNIEEKMLGGKFVYIEEANKNGVEITQVSDNKVIINKIKAGDTVTLKYEYVISGDTQVTIDDNEKFILENKVTAKGKIEVEDPENPENTITKEVEDEATEEIEIITKQTEDQLGIIKKDLETGETIEGAVIGLYAAENITERNGNILIAKDTLIEKVTTDALGRAKYTVDLPLGKYYIKEIEAPAGYYLSEEKIEIDASYKNQDIKTINVSKILINTSISVKIQKKDSEGNLLKGAKLEIVDGQGKVVDSWESREEVHMFRRVQYGKTYTLREVEPAKGYATAEDISFKMDEEEKLYYFEESKDEGITVKEYNETERIEMVDQKTKVKIEIKDKETEEQIPGLKVQIIDKETGEVVYEYETTEDPETLEGLPIGEYTILIVDPESDRYGAITEDIEVKDTEELQEFEIEISKLYCNFAIEKTISSIRLNGKDVQISDNQLTKVEIKSSEIKKAELVATYNIKVINEGEVRGKAVVLEMIPEGYTIVTAPEYWKARGDGTLEAEVELKPGESRDLTLTLRWINQEDHLGAKSNTAKIAGIENDANYTDRNKEDDISTATIVVSIKTGGVISAIIIIMLIVSFMITGYMIITSIKGMGKGPNIRKIRFLNRW